MIVATESMTDHRHPDTISLTEDVITRGLTPVLHRHTVHVIAALDAVIMLSVMKMSTVSGVLEAVGTELKESNVSTVVSWDTSQIRVREMKLLLLLLVLVLVESSVTLVDNLVTKHTSAVTEEIADRIRNKICFYL
jgi:hypothetical protein